MSKRSIILLGLVGLVVFIMGGFFYFRHTQKQLHRFKVTFFDIGQGDSTFIQFENGEQMLIDCGADRKVLARLGKAMPFYDRTIDYVVATHPDLDHYGGCVDVLERYQVKKIIINGKKKEDDAYWREFDRAVGNEVAEIIVMASPTVWTIAANTLEFISPDPTLKLDVKADDGNNYSIVFKLTHSDKSFLFTGDMEMPLEKAVMERYCSTKGVRAGFGCPALRADILKVGHHGSDSSSSEEFLAVVRPKKASISAGRKNKYGHPSLRVIRRLERNGAEVLRTDRSGDILIE